MKETTFTNMIRAELFAVGALVLKVHGNAFQEVGWPDLLVWCPSEKNGTLPGRSFGIELKVGKRKATAKQVQRLEHLCRVGSLGVVLRGGTDPDDPSAWQMETARGCVLYEYSDALIRNELGSSPDAQDRRRARGLHLLRVLHNVSPVAGLKGLM